MNARAFLYRRKNNTPASSLFTETKPAVKSEVTKPNSEPEKPEPEKPEPEKPEKPEKPEPELSTQVEHPNTQNKDDECDIEHPTLVITELEKS